MGESRRWFRFSIWRFSLRSLLLLVTAVCVFLGYQLEWIRRRRAFIDEQLELRYPSSWQNFGSRVSQDRFLLAWEQLQNRSPKRAPYLLWLFREHGWGQVDVILTDGLTRREIGQQEFGEVRYYASRSHPTLVQARRLFPEAGVTPYVDRLPDGMIRFKEVVQE